MPDFEPNARVFTAFACELSRGPPTGLRRTISVVGNSNALPCSRSGKQCHGDRDERAAAAVRSSSSGNTALID